MIAETRRLSAIELGIRPGFGDHKRKLSTRWLRKSRILHEQAKLFAFGDQTRRPPASGILLKKAARLRRLSGIAFSTITPARTAVQMVRFVCVGAPCCVCDSAVWGKAWNEASHHRVSGGESHTRWGMETATSLQTMRRPTSCGDHRDGSRRRSVYITPQQLRMHRRTVARGRCG